MHIFVAMPEVHIAFSPGLSILLVPPRMPVVAITRRKEQTAQRIQMFRLIKKGRPIWAGVMFSASTEQVFRFLLPPHIMRGLKCVLSHSLWLHSVFSNALSLFEMTRRSVIRQLDTTIFWLAPCFYSLYTHPKAEAYSLRLMISWTARWWLHFVFLLHVYHVAAPHYERIAILRDMKFNARAIDTIRAHAVLENKHIQTSRNVLHQFVIVLAKCSVSTFVINATNIISTHLLCLLFHP